MAPASRVEELFEHTEWVRALTLRLCRDDAEADDLAQETWLRAVICSDGARVARAWLSGVARNVAARSRRSAAARNERERVAARSEAVPGPDELLAQAELQQRVLAAVAELDEASRTAVLWRYYEGLSAEQIARRIGQPSSSVRSRISRALEQLRRRLDREFGSRAAWAAVGAPFAHSIPTAKLAAGAGMASKTAIGAGAASVLAVLAWRAVGSRPREDASVPAATPVERVALASAANSRELDTASERSLRERTPVAPGAAPRFERMLVWGRLNGLAPAALGSARKPSLEFIDERGDARSATLSENGSFSIFGLTPGRWRAWCMQTGYLPLDEEFELDGGAERVQRDFALEPAGRIRVHWLDAVTGEPLVLRNHAALHDCLAVMATRGAPPRPGGLLERTVGWNDCASYERGGSAVGATRSALEDRELALRAGPPLVAHALLRDFALASLPIEMGATELVFRIDPAQIEALTARVIVRCIDGASRAPLAGARIQLGFSGVTGEQATTDEQGLARFEGTAPGARQLQAMTSSGAVSLPRWVQLDPGAEHDLGELVVQPLAACSGRVVGPEGSGVPASISYVLEARDGSAPWLVRSNVEAAIDGSFRVAELPLQPLRLVVSAPGFGVTSVPVEGRREGLEIALQRGFEVRVRLARGVAAHRSVRVVDRGGNLLATGMVAPLHDAKWTLAPGAYWLEEMHGLEPDRSTSFVIMDREVLVELESL